MHLDSMQSDSSDGNRNGNGSGWLSLHRQQGDIAASCGPQLHLKMLLTWPLGAGTVQLQYTGTRKEMLDKGLQQCLLPEENPLHEATPFKRQIWHSKLGLA